MMFILQKMILKILLFAIFYVTTSYFSSICFIVIPSTPKLVNCFIGVLFTTSFETQQVDQTFAVTVEIIIDFICSYKAMKSTKKSIKMYKKYSNQPDTSVYHTNNFLLSF